MQVNRKLFAEKLKAFKDEPNQQTKSIVGFGMKVLENIQQRILPNLSFKGIGEIPVPIHSEDLEKLKSVSQPVSNLRGLWEIDLQSDTIDKDYSHYAKYLSQTIPIMTDLTLRQIKVSREQVQGLDVRPRKLTIMEPGTGIILHQMNNTPEVFATMIVQLPIQGGHEGGLIKVTRDKQLCSFENALDSSRLFYYTIVMSNTSCHMAELSSGSRVMMTFDLTCTNPSALFPSSTCLKDVSSILLQLSPHGPDRLLAIPLDKEEVTFSSLVPGTRRLLDLFNSMNFLHVRLGVVCHYRTGTANQRMGCPCCQKRKCPCEDVVMAQVSEEKITTTKWLDPSDKEMHFQNLNINTNTEIVGDGPTFFEKPTQEILQPGTCLLEQWFHRPMLVIWHKERSVQLDCFHRFDILLKNLEHETKSEVQHSLDEVLTFCEKHPDIAWETENASIALLKLCLRSSASDKVIRLLDVLGNSKGIHTKSMADLLAEVVSSIGWDLCANSIDKLVCCNRAQEQMHNYSRLALALLNIGCHPAAVAIISKICVILSTANVMASLELPVFAACIDLMATFDENLLTKDPQRLANLATQTKEKLGSFATQIQLLIHVQQLLNARPPERIPDTAIVWYYTLCLHLSGLAIPITTPLETILSALKLLISSGDSSLSEALVSNLTTKENQENGVLRRLIGAEAFWKFSEESVENKKIVGLLTDKRIQWLIAIPKPVATWAVPNASVFGHPVVENFMRSNERSMTYSNFNNIRHARNWSNKHYYEIGPYAELEVGGAGCRAYCEITKLKMRYARSDVKNAVCRKELMELIEQRLKKLGDALYSVVKNEETNEICAVEAIQSRGPTSETVNVSVKNVPYTAISPQVVTSTPIVMNRAGTQSMNVMSNVQQAVKPPASKDQQMIIKSTVIPPKPATAVTYAAAKKTEKKETVVKKISPAKVLSVNQTKQQVFPSVQTTKLPAYKKPNVAVIKRLLPTNSPLPTASKKPGVAKRPIAIETFLPANVNPSTAVPNPGQATNVKEELISSPAKRIKLELV